MPASPNDPRTKRRKAAGDDINKMGMAPQPIPGLTTETSKGGNAMLTTLLFDQRRSNGSARWGLLVAKSSCMEI